MTESIMNINPSACPYCGTLINRIATSEGIAPAEGDVTLCMSCGSFLLFGPMLSLKKCLLTPDEMNDKLGLLLYGELLIVQNQIKHARLISAMIKGY